MKIVPFAFLFLLATYVQAQIPFLDWVKESEMGKGSTSNTATIDSDGNFYTLHRGEYQGKDVNPGKTDYKVWTKNQNGKPVISNIISKFDARGNYLWTQQLVDSVNSNQYSIAVSSRYVYLAGTVNASFIPDKEDSAYHVIPNTRQSTLIVKYDKENGKFIDEIRFDEGVYINEIQIDEKDQLWVLGFYFGSVDLAPNSNGIIMTSGDEGAFAMCMDSEFNVQKNWHQSMKRHGTFDLSIGNEHVMLNTSVGRRTPMQDTLFFANDTLLITGSEARKVYFVFDTSLTPRNIIYTSHKGTDWAFDAILEEDELLITTFNCPDLKGIIDTSFSAFIKPRRNWRYNFKTKNHRYLEGSNWGTPVGKWKGDYLLLDDSLYFTLLDSSTDAILYRFTPEVVYQGFQSPVYKKKFGIIYTYGYVRGKLNFGTEEWPILITDGTENASSSDLYFGRFDTLCSAITDSSIYSEEITQCGVLYLHEEIDIRGYGLRYRWYNEKLDQKLNDAEWFDSPNGLAQFIRGSTSPYLSYQWDVEKGSIPGPYRVLVTSVCGDSLVTPPIKISAYGEPNVGSAVEHKEYKVGDTLKMWVVPDERFDTIKYAWVKDEFFMFDWGPIQGTSDSVFYINGLEEEHSGIYGVVAYHPKCPQHYSRTSYPLLVQGEDTINKDWTTVQQLAAEIQHRLYPNPAQDELNIDLTGMPNSVNVRIYTVLGKKVYEEDLMQQQVLLNTSEWMSGTYIVRFSVGNKQLVTRWIKL